MTSWGFFTNNLKSSTQFILKIVSIFDEYPTTLASVRHQMVIEKNDIGSLRCIIYLDYMDQDRKDLITNIVFQAKEKLQEFKCVELVYNEKIIFYWK